MNNQIIIIAGPTASGKTNFAIKLAQQLSGEVINADSLQIYTENPILSAQPTIEEKQNIPHHLFGYVKGSEEYNIARWIKDSAQIIKEMDKLPILVGGTGFYLKHLIFGLSQVPEVPIEIRIHARELLENIGAKEFHQLLKSLDPIMAAKLEPNNSNRTLRAYEVIKTTGKSINHWQQQNISYFPLKAFKLIILQPCRDTLYTNCNQRFLDMLKLGAIEEVRYLIKQNYNLSTGIMKSHGAPELKQYLLGEWSLDQAVEKSQQVVRNYAKRQTTWFKHQFNHPELKTLFVQDPSEEFTKVIKFIQEL